MLKSLNHHLDDSCEYMQKKWIGTGMRRSVSGSSSLLQGSSTLLNESEAADLKDLVILSYFSVEREERKGEANSTRLFLFIDEIFNES